jgi:DNA-binding beta-propeller fold protein YncE
MKFPHRQGLGAMSMLRALAGAAALSLPWVSTLAPQAAMAASPSFIAFESGQVRPLAMSADGSRLFAVNTPNATLDIFNITSSGLQLFARVPVGLEPVAVALRNDNEVWVVNHLSDSVSIVSLDGAPRVVRTLLVGDEPRDIVFAGAPAKAFITTAHRGQQRSDPSLAGVPGAGDPQLTTPGIGRADVWVFNPASLGSAMGGVPVSIKTFFADTPRALAVSPDHNTVYVAAFKSGNETSSVNEFHVCDSFELNKTCSVEGVTMPGGRLGPQTNAEGKPAPKTGLMIKYNRQTKHWEDIKGRNWDPATPYNLPDKDVFAVDANTLQDKTIYAHVGTTLFNMAVNPVTGNLYVSNTEANNMTRFEGPGQFGGSTVQGKIALARVTVIAGPNVMPRHLNKHIDYSKLVNDPGFDATAKDHSLSMPTEMAVSKDGNTMYVAAYGSSRIGVFNVNQLETDSFNPRTASANYISVSGGGPSGLVLDENRGRMYVMTRFDNAIKVVNLATRSEMAQAVLPNPEPAAVVKGRPMLYDARLSSANGEASCASCHIFGDMDDIAWDLGNPDDVVTKSPIPGKFTSPLQFQGAKFIFNVKNKINGSDDPKDFHPMKGPMVTQTLRGMINSGAMHWRGDRSNGIFGISASDANLSFKNFAVAFAGLLGNAQPMSEADMQTFADFMLQVQMPPNPIRKLDNTLTASQQRGHDFYFGDRPADGFKLVIGGKSVLENNNCNGCHTVDAAQGMFGTGGFQSFEGISQIVKVPQLRNMYAKVGRFGSAAIPFSTAKPTGHQGDQVRGFGFVHDGTADTLAHFFTVRVFQPTLNSGFPLFNPDDTRRDVADFMHVMDSDLAPIVGQQVTLTAANASNANPRIDLLIARTKTPFVSKELGGSVTECDLVAHVVEGGTRRGYVYDAASATFVATDNTRRSDAALRSLATAPGQEVTYTCAPPGSGRRLASLAQN